MSLAKRCMATVLEPIDDVAKHGSHDQSSHGRKGSGSTTSGDTYKPTTKITVRNNQKPGHLRDLDRDDMGADWDPDIDYGERANELSNSAESIFNADFETEDGETFQTLVQYTEDYGIGKGILVQGMVYSEDSGRVGEFQRTLLPDEGYVDMHLFKLDSGVQGKGLGTAVVTHWENQFAESGYSEMKVHAVSSSSMNGAYTWAKYGYTPNEGGQVFSQFLDNKQSELKWTDGDYERPETPLAAFIGAKYGAHGSNDYARRRKIGEELGGLNNILDLIADAPGYGDYLKGDAEWYGSKEIVGDQVAKSAKPNKYGDFLRNLTATRPELFELEDDQEFWALFDEYRNKIGVAKHGSHDQSSHGRKSLAGIKAKYPDVKLYLAEHSDYFEISLIVVLISSSPRRRTSVDRSHDWKSSTEGSGSFRIRVRPGTSGHGRQ